MRQWNKVTQSRGFAPFFFRGVFRPEVAFFPARFLLFYPSALTPADALGVSFWGLGSVPSALERK